MDKNSWLVVADCSLARIFKFENAHSIAEFIVLEHPESRMHNLDIVSDKPGRDFESVGSTRHGVGHAMTPKKHEFAVFAKDIAYFLQQAKNKNEFEHLYIAAGPKFLGLLREALNPELRKLIRGEIDKELTHLTADKIISNLQLHYVT